MHDRLIIEDDYDNEFRYFSKPIPCLQGLAGGENVVYLSTFSKLLLPSIRLSFMILGECNMCITFIFSPGLVDREHQYSVCGSPVTQFIAGKETFYPHVHQKNGFSHIYLCLCAKGLLMS